MFFLKFYMLWVCEFCAQFYPPLVDNSIFPSLKNKKNYPLPVDNFLCMMVLPRNEIGETT
jgi:hypothetical protein